MGLPSDLLLLGGIGIFMAGIFKAIRNAFIGEPGIKITRRTKISPISERTCCHDTERWDFDERTNGVFCQKCGSLICPVCRRWYVWDKAEQHEAPACKCLP